jgi:hypothetical protein
MPNIMYFYFFHSVFGCMGILFDQKLLAFRYSTISTVSFGLEDRLIEYERRPSQRKHEKFGGVYRAECALHCCPIYRVLRFVATNCWRAKSCNASRRNSNPM